MSGTLVRKALRRSLAQTRHVSAVPPAAAGGLVAEVYAQVEQDFGMLAPPVALHSPAPGPLAACWMMLRETLLAAGMAGRAAREVVAAAVSLGNTCPYCVAVHATTLHTLVRGDAAAAIAGDRIDSIADPGVRELAAWARASGLREQAVRREPPFPAEQAPELAGVAVTFQYLNRMVSVFLEDTPVPPGVPAAARAGMMRLLGRFLRPAALRAPAPGAASSLLPAAPLPSDLRWAAGNAAVADAFARAAAAIDAAGGRAVAAAVRELVTAELTRWDGQPRGPSRAWADGPVSRLARADRAAGRVALLTALAPYQVGQSDVDEFQRGHPGDETLVELTSWASLAAARTVGGWIGDAALRTSGRSAPAG